MIEIYDRKGFDSLARVEQNTLRGADLSGKDLSNANLDGADLIGATTIDRAYPPEVAK